MLDKIGFGEGDSGQGEWQPHHTRHGTRMDKQPTILAVHSPSRIRNAIARVLPLATPLWVGPMCGGWPRPRAELPSCSVFYRAIVPTLVCTTTPANLYGRHIKYKISRISYTMPNPDPASAVLRSGVDRRGARRRTHRHTRRSAFALTFALITRRFNPSNKPDAKYPTRPICGALSSLRSAVHR
jgi:hypothetical protein